MSDEQQLPVPSEKASTPVPRLSSPSQIQTHGLTAERAAKIVNQSGSSRMAALLGIAIVTLFVIVYAFYDQGLPGVTGSSRLDAAKREQYLESVKRGYNLYEANCARCHGEQGQGDQGKLLAHLTPQYLMNVLTVGGRYICGDSKSLMGVWADTNGGPLNYREIEELIDWVRATTGDVVEVRDPKTGEMIEVTGWRDVAYAPAPGATPVPACWKDAFAVSPTPTGSATPMPSGGMGETYQISAVNPIAFEQTSFETAAGVPFTIVFSNNNVGVPHNVAIHVGTATGTEVFKGEIFPGIGTRTYNVPALTAGTYAFICTVHPNMAGTLTVK